MALSEYVDSLGDTGDGPGDEDDALSDADLWDKHFAKWRAQGHDDTDAADRATNVVEHRRATKRRLVPLEETVRRGAELDEGEGGYRVGPIEHREREEAARVTPGRLLAQAEQASDATMVADTPREAARRATGDAKRRARAKPYDLAELRHGAGRAAQMRAQATDPELAHQLEADEENLTKAARSLEDIDTFGGRASQAFWDVANTVMDSPIAKRGATADLASALDTEGMARRGVTGHDVGEKLTTTRPFSIGKDFVAPVVGTLPYQIAGEAGAAAALGRGAEVATSMGRTGTARMLTEGKRMMGPLDHPTFPERVARGATAGQVPFALSAAGGAKARGADPVEAAELSLGEGVPFGLAGEFALAGAAHGRDKLREIRNRPSLLERLDEPTRVTDADGVVHEHPAGSNVFTESELRERARGTPEERHDLLETLGRSLEEKRETTPIRTAIGSEDLSVSDVARTRRAVPTDDPQLPDAYTAALKRQGGMRPSERPVRGAAEPVESGTKVEMIDRPEMIRREVERGQASLAQGSDDLLDRLSRTIPREEPPALPMSDIDAKLAKLKDRIAAGEEPTLRLAPGRTAQYLADLDEARALVGTPEELWESLSKAERKDWQQRAPEGSHPMYTAWNKHFDDVMEVVQRHGPAAGLGIAALLSGDDDDKGGLALAASTALVPHSIRRTVLARLETGVRDNVPGYRELQGPVGWGERFHVDGIVSSEQRAKLVQRLHEYGEKVGKNLLTPEDVKAALADAPPREPGRAPLRSRLRDAVNALPKAWDAPRPASDWIGKLTGSEASKFSKQEFALIRPALDEAVAEKRKLGRDDISALMDEKLPEIEQVTLASAAKAATPGHQLENAPDTEWEHDDIDTIRRTVDNPAGDTVPVTELPAYLRDQVLHRENRVREIEDEIETEQNRLAGIRDDAEEAMSRRQTELEEVLAEANLPTVYVNKAIEYLDDHVEAEYVPRDAVEKAMAKIEDSLFEADRGSAEDFLQSADHRIEEEPANPKRERRVRSTWATPIQHHGLPRTSLDFRLTEGRTKEEHLARIRELYGEEAARNAKFYNYKGHGRRAKAELVTPGGGTHRFSIDLRVGHSIDDAIEEIDRAYRNAYGVAIDITPNNVRLEEREPPMETVVYDGNDRVVARDADRETALESAAERLGWSSTDMDQLFNDVQQRLRDYAEARAEWSRAESEHFFATDDEGERFTNEVHEKEALETELEELETLAENVSSAVEPFARAAADDRAEGAPETEAPTDPTMIALPPKVGGAARYESYQRIGGGTDYRELLNIWANNSGTAYSKGHYGRQGYPNATGHARVENHTVRNIPGISGAKIEHIPGESDAVRHAKDALNEKRRARDRMLDGMGEIARRYEALADREGSEAQALARQYEDLNQHAIDLSKREGELESELARQLTSGEGEGAAWGTTEKVAVMIENQSDWAQDAGRIGVEHEAVQLPSLQTEYDGVRARIADLRNQFAEWARKTQEEQGDERLYNELAFYGDYGMEDGDRRVLVEKHPEIQPVVDEYIREHEREIELERRIMDVKNADGVPASPFLKGHEAGKVEGEAAYALNTARFLIDSAERNHDRIAWSDAANRVKNAHLPIAAAKLTYDTMIPAQVKRMLAGLGFKDVGIEKLFIRGEGHWSLRLTPEMRKAIRTVGLPILSLLAVAGAPDEAEAQEPGEEGATVSASDAAVAGAVGLAATALGVTLYRSGLRAAFKDIASRGVVSNPLVLGALGTAMMQVPDDDFENFGKGVIGLAALKAVGSARMKKAGGSVGRMVVDAAKSWGAQGVVRAFTPEALLSPEVLTALQAFREQSAKGRARAAEYTKKLSAKGSKVNRAVTDLMRGENWEGPLSPDDATAALTMAVALAEQTEELGIEKVGRGIITPEQYEASGGPTYLPRIYAEHEAPKANPALARDIARGEGRPLRMSEQRSRTLDDLEPAERDRIRNDLGEIRESSYLASASLERGWRDVGVSVLMQELRQSPDAMHPDWVTAYDDLQMGRVLQRQATTPADKLAAKQMIDDAKGRLRDVTRKFETRQGDYVALPSSEGLGDLAGAVVQRDVALAINGLPDVPGIGGLYRWWKQSKTVWNPGTHIANVAGNMTMLHMAGLPLTRQPKWLNAALDDLANYGDATRDLMEHGILNTVPLDSSMPHRPRGGPTFGDLLALRDDTRPATAAVLEERGIKSAGERLADRGHPVAGDLLDRVGSGLSRVDETVGVRKVARDAQQLYQNEDNAFRIAAYLWRKDEGDSDEAARAFARTELIDFHTRSPLLHIARNTIAPFVLFPAKALPTFGRHLVDHPERWITVTAALLALNEFGEQESGYDFQPGDIPERDRTSGFGALFPELIQLPAARDEHGGVAATDFMRWSPGQAVTQGAPEHSVAGRLGLPQLLTPSGPLIDIGASLGANKDAFTGKDITAEHGTAALPDYLEYAGKEMLPSAATLHAPRFVGDLEKGNPGKAATDALGFLGARPRYFRPGEGARRAKYELEDYLTTENRSLKRDLAESESPDYSARRKADSRAKRARAVRRAKEQMTALP